jgi:hypothetical protein
MSRTLVLSAAIICGLALLPGQPTSLEAAGLSLVGSWQLTFVPATPPIPAIPIQGLATFTSDGTMIETDTSEVVPGVAASGTGTTYATPGHGIWQPGPAITTLFVQFFSVVANPDASLYGKTTVTITASLDTTGTKMKGGYESVLTDPSGNVLRSITGTITGSLIPHPKLP